MKRWLLSTAVLAAVACGGDAARSSSVTAAARSSEVPASESDQGGVDVFDASPPTRGVSRREPLDAGPKDAAHQAGSGHGGSSAAASTQRARAPQMVDAGARSSSRSQPIRSAARDAGEHRTDAAADAEAQRADAASEPAELDASAPRVDVASGPDAGGPTPSSPGSPSSPSSPSSPGSPSAESDAGSAAASSGSCCSVSDKPGCGDPALQACVCAQQPSCCSGAWDATCTRLVAEKVCQSGVRDCVCGSGEGQWQQAQCCTGSWDDTCESVATNKCGATADCP